MITEFADEYSSLLTADYFNAEITNLQQKQIKRRKASDRGDWPENLLQLQCYVHRLRDAFAELDKLITIPCTLPVSTASCERSFSTLQIVKSYLRTSMGNGRLHDLLILGDIAQLRASMLNLDNVVSRFTRKYATCEIQLDQF